MRYSGIMIASILLLASACASHRPAEPSRITPPPAREYAVISIPLAGDLSQRQAEISGLAWLGDNFVVLPQYPHRFGQNIFVIEKKQILDFLDGKSAAPLVARKIAFQAPGLAGSIAGFEGFEAIAFRGRQAFLTIESRPGAKMQGYVIAGHMADDLSALCLDTAALTEIPGQSGLHNMSDEALLIVPGGLVSFHEANGLNVNPHPRAHRFGWRLEPLASVPFATIEYRITDASTLDEQGRFWAINYFYPGERDKLDPAADRLAGRYGQGPTHRSCETVERLVEFSYSPRGIEASARPPLQLELIDDDHSRNWEGIVRLDDRGFLLMSDKHPATLLGFVPLDRP